MFQNFICFLVITNFTFEPHVSLHNSGVVDKLLSAFEKSVFSNEEAGLNFMNRFLKMAGIVRKSYQGAHSLEVWIYVSLYSCIMRNYEIS